MKRHLLSGWGVAAGVSALLVVSAQAQERKWYARVDAGATLINNTDVEDFVEPVTGEMEFDPGYGFGVAGGYRIAPWLAVEMQTGYTLNGVDDLDAVLTQLPFTANLVYECTYCGKFVPFLGVGAGGVTSIFSVDDAVSVGSGTFSLDGSDGDIVFAYQAFGGFRYEFNDRMSVGFLYRFRGSGAPEWDVEDDFTGDTIGQIRLDDMFTHTFSVLFSADF